MPLRKLGNMRQPMEYAGEVISMASKKFPPAIFVGYSQNMGLSTVIDKVDVAGTSLAFMGRGIGMVRIMGNMLRIAPRLGIYAGKSKMLLNTNNCEVSGC